MKEFFINEDIWAIISCLSSQQIGFLMKAFRKYFNRDDDSVQDNIAEVLDTTEMVAYRSIIIIDELQQIHKGMCVGAGICFDGAERR